jgi:Na+/melibiose symporter-like transporter
VQIGREYPVEMPAGTLWRDREFVKLWSGQAISQIGSRITRTALPFAAVLVLGAGPLQMGILGGVSAAAILLFGLFAGAWADRVRRKPILIFTDLGRAAVLATVPLAAWRGSLTMMQLYVVAAVSGLLTVLFDVSYQAYVPSLVKRDNLVSANAKLALSESIAEVSGPGIAGFLIQALTAPIAIVFDAASFLLSAASIALVRREEPAPAERSGTDIFEEIGDGLRTCWGNPYLRVMALRTATAVLFAGFFASLYPLLTVKVLGLTPAAIGVVISTGGAFAIGGAALAERLVGRLGIGRAMLGALLMTGVTTFLHPMAHGSVALCCAFLIAGQAGDFAWPLLTTTEMSLRQATAPPERLARVNSAMSLMFNGIIPVGSFVGGALAEAIGVREAMFVGAAGYALSSLWVILSPIRELRELPAANAASSAVT